MNTKISEIKSKDYSCHGKILTFNTPQVMAILNITPDSFYDGGKYSSETDILNDAAEKIEKGASIIDLGAASSRPGAKEISAEEEWQRLHKILPELRKNFPKTFISIDTYRSDTAIKAADMGADIINDISGGNLDTAMFETVVRLNLPYVLMHMQGTPQTMQKAPTYKDVVTEVESELKKKTEKFLSSGFEKIILDPGFGFGKDTRHNFSLLKSLNAFTALGFPVLAGMSRKRMINQVIGTNPVSSLNGTTVVNTMALLKGASILRVHDVQEAKQAIELVEFYNQA